MSGPLPTGPAPVYPTSPPLLRLASWAQAIQPSAIQDMLRLLSRPDLLSLALGLPAAELFPSAALADAVGRVLGSDPRALQYQPPLGRLKEQVVSLMALRGVTCTESQVFLTAGAQQGMNLLVRLLLDPGSTVVLEERAYSGFQQVLEPYNPRVLTVPSDLSTGMEVAALERLLANGERPALVYAISDGHNPLGVSMSLEKRRRLVALARTHGIPIIEDDAYGFLSYEDRAPPPLRALDDRWVFYVGTFSKILAPALRTGWLIVPEELTARLSVVKESTDLDTTTLAQRGISAYLETGTLDAHLSELRRQYRARRDAMVSALREHFPREARFATPSAGMFVWVDLPGEVDTARLLARAVEVERVAFLPGQAFWVKGGPRPTNGMRLNFSHCPPARIEEGVRRLARALREMAP